MPRSSPTARTVAAAPPLGTGRPSLHRASSAKTRGFHTHGRMSAAQTEHQPAALAPQGQSTSLSGPGRQSSGSDWLLASCRPRRLPGLIPRGPRVPPSRVRFGSTWKNHLCNYFWASLVAQLVRNLPAMRYLPQLRHCMAIQTRTQAYLEKGLGADL